MENKELKVKLTEIEEEWNDILTDFFSQANLKQKQILVVGCSTSEVIGERIGQSSSMEIANSLMPPLLERCTREGIFLAIQGCEHINRALVIDRECMDYYRLDEVTVIPALKAGGAMTLKAWQCFKSPVMVEEIKGHAGIDIGDTFIGMHLRPVVIPLRLTSKHLGQAHITAARTRPRLIGGARAKYPS